MFAVIDCGTTMTRIYIINENKQIIASGRKKIGVRDTSISGSREILRQGISQLFFQVIHNHGISDDDVTFAIASGMITSEIGLKEIPHLVAPVGLKELADGIVKVDAGSVLPIPCPVYFVPGIRNNYPANACAKDLRKVDFMRGEEVQCIGIMDSYQISIPGYIVALSSHSKIMYINKERKIEASSTTISGQLYEALKNSSNIGTSIIPTEGEEAGGYSFEELVEIAADCVHHVGLTRTLLMPRFLHVLMKTNGEERRLFLDAAIAVDDMKAFREFQKQGYYSDYYLLYGHLNRCKLYEYLLKQEFGSQVIIQNISRTEDLDRLTIDGVVSVAQRAIEAKQERVTR